ncbi:MAG: dihydroorotate dehydrogenase-like protein [Candidatus Eisenbacteria bacterium]|nr:dihydroorotate dehydrogenase-like protein [Candidatus Eisenbacteria bacterium]
MDLSTKYLGLDLAHPLMPGAAPFVADLDTVRELEDAGASAIVMNSLFEEQIVAEQLAQHRAVDAHAESFAEAASYFPKPMEYSLGPEEYLGQLRKIKESVKVPVIASLNGTTKGGWLDYARLMQEAGADALELNIYYLATDPSETSSQVEDREVDIVRELKKSIRVPIAVKLSPFYSSLPNFASRVVGAGADGLVLFNRFYQPDINVEELEVERSLNLSDSNELLVRLRWLAILSGNVNASLAVTGGVHTTSDAIKAIMTGADAVQLVSSLFLKGMGHLKTMREGLERWLEEHEYESLSQMRGSMNLLRCPDPESYERANYMHILQSWRAGD